MSARAALAALVWALVVLGFVALVSAATVPVAHVPASAKPQHSVPLPEARSPSPNRDSAALLVTAHDLFRRSRRPATATSVAPLPAIQPTVARPPLRLLGFVTGRRPTAVIMGFPGVAGARLVRQGDAVAGFTVRRINAQGVEVVGADTTWLLTVRRP